LLGGKGDLEDGYCLYKLIGGVLKGNLGIGEKGVLTPLEHAG
jgi:hypothetical protein